MQSDFNSPFQAHPSQYNSRNVPLRQWLPRGERPSGYLRLPCFPLLVGATAPPSATGVATGGREPKRALPYETRRRGPPDSIRQATVAPASCRCALPRRAIPCFPLKRGRSMRDRLATKMTHAHTLLGRGLLWLLTLVPACGGHDHTRRAHLAEGPVGTRFVPPEIPVSAVPSTPFLGSRCRVIVLTAAGCGVSKALIQGWVDDLAPVTDSLAFPVEAAWLFFGTGEESADLRSAAGGTLPRIFVTPGGLNRMEDLLGVLGSPHTVLVDATDTIRALLSGNRLPTFQELEGACGRHEQ